MSRTIVLVMHGAPPRDFPRQDTAEFFSLGSRLRQAGGPERAAMERRHAELDAKMRSWPRTPENDPFYTASVEMAHQLEKANGAPVIVAFGEFCAPTTRDALDEAATRASEVVVITPMMTRGGEHSEAEIPAEVRRASERHPDVKFSYVWPFASSEVAAFLSSQIDQFMARS